MLARLATQISPEFNDNVLTPASTFDYSEFTINKTGGGAASGVSYDNTYCATGVQCIKSYNELFSGVNTPLTFDLGTALQFTVQKSGTYRLSFFLMQENDFFDYYADKFKIKITVNGAYGGLFAEYTLPSAALNEPNIDRLLFYRLESQQTFGLVAGQVINFSFEHNCDPTTASGHSTLRIDALKLEICNKFGSIYGCTAYTRPKNGLELLPTANGNYHVNIASGVATYTVDS